MNSIFRHATMETYFANRHFRHEVPKCTIIFKVSLDAQNRVQPSAFGVFRAIDIKNINPPYKILLYERISETILFNANSDFKHSYFSIKITVCVAIDPDSVLLSNYLTLVNIPYPFFMRNHLISSLVLDNLNFKKLLVLQRKS